MARTTKTSGWRTWLALLLVGLLGLQGCTSVGTKLASAEKHRSAAPSMSLVLDAPGVVGSLTGHGSPSATPMCGGYGFGLSGGEAALLIGLLIVAAPFWLAYEVIASPVTLLRHATRH